MPDFFQPQEKKKNSTLLYVLLIAIALSVFGYLSFGGSFLTSFATFDEQLKAQSQEITVTHTNLSACYEFNERLFSHLAACESNISYQKAVAEIALQEKETADAACKQEKQKEQEQYTFQLSEQEKQLQEELIALKTTTDASLASLQKQLAAAKEEEQVIAAAARNICCKERVDDPTIAGYDVVERKIVCSAAGTKQLLC